MTITTSSSIKKLLLLFLIFAGLYYARDFLIPFAIGAVLATLLLPFSKWLERRRIGRGLAAFLCLLLLIVIIAGISFLLAWQISELASDFGQVREKVGAKANSIQKYIYDHIGISVEQQWGILKSQQSSIPNVMQTIAGSLTYIFAGFIFVLVYVAFLLYYRTHLKNFILKLFPTQKEEAEEVVFKAANVSQQYLLGLAKMIACLWIMYSIGFSIIGIKNPLFYAFLCGLLEIVPYIGNITGTSITLLISSIHGAELPMLIGIVATYGTVQFIQGWVLEPFMLGPQVKINPLITILVLVIGQLIWGIPGVVLAIPLTAMFKIVCDHIPSLKPYGFLIGEVPSQKKEGFVERIKK
jgi:predicted PurR-regulated permease PerM